MTVDRVSRTNVPGIYAAGDCTGVLPLASVAAMQGRIAMWHALGEAVAPLRLRTVVGQRLHRPGAGHRRRLAGRCGQRQGAGPAVMLPLAGNARAKMAGLARRLRQAVLPPGVAAWSIGGVVVAPKASELILPIAMAVENHLTVDQLAHTITIYPSLSGSIAEAARQLMQHEFGVTRRAGQSIPVRPGRATHGERWPTSVRIEQPLGQADQQPVVRGRRTRSSPRPGPGWHGERA